MVQATTPTFTFTFPSTIDPSTFQKTVFSLEQEGLEFEKTGEDLTIEGQTISVSLTQKETLSLKVGKAEVQLNWLYPDGTRACSDINEIAITKNLLQEILE